jgi:hypothetical protein
MLLNSMSPAEVEFSRRCGMALGKANLDTFDRSPVGASVRASIAATLLHAGAFLALTPDDIPWDSAITSDPVCPGV